ncbi:MAG: monovalent cation/H(+) antiporter subunit G [Kiritimatiellae bacterium]|nr:monovalent cation/H(+) antiporter subunit G [Kiritimatiellia bacterium]MDW8459324.1 monovalent cation/H(+) antiporter subunit G [Verrucomicrobiota bacterium]
MKDLLTAFFMTVGSVFMFLAALGVFRMPDLYTRMHAASKVGTVGVICVMMAVAIHFGDLGVTTRALLIILFFLITAPVAAHMIGRSAFFARTPMWEGTVINEWPDLTKSPSEGPDVGGEAPRI